MAENPLKIIIEFMISPIGIFLIALAVVGFLIYYILTHRQPSDEFEEQTLEQICLDNMEKELKLKGQKVKGSITRGLSYYGKIDQIAEKLGSFEVGVIDDKGNVDYAGKIQEKLFYIVKIKGIKLLELLGLQEKKILLVSKDSIQNFDTYNKKSIITIKENYDFDRIAGVWVNDNYGREMVENLAYRQAYENVLTTIPNHTRKQSYIELKQPRRVEYMTKKENVRSEGFNKYKKAEGTEESGEDLEED